MNLLGNVIFQETREHPGLFAELCGSKPGYRMVSAETSVTPQTRCHGCPFCAFIVLKAVDTIGNCQRFSLHSWCISTNV